MDGKEIYYKIKVWVGKLSSTLTSDLYAMITKAKLEWFCVAWFSANTRKKPNDESQSWSGSWRIS